MRESLAAYLALILGLLPRLGPPLPAPSLWVLLAALTALCVVGSGQLLSVPVLPGGSVVDTEGGMSP